MNIQTLIDDEVNRIGKEIVSLRRVIHEHPEIGLEVFHTAHVIVQSLHDSGIPCKDKVGGAGVVVHIEGKEPGPCILLRADMDGLPLTEETGLGYASKVKGKMHACGHDLHAAALTGVAKILWSLRGQLKGSFKLVFQPGEETLDGAEAMIEDGLLVNPVPQAALGFHNWPSLATGSTAYHPIVSFAGSQAFSLTLTGLSGHAAHPHSAIDTITAAANFIMQLQTIVSREIAPVKPAVISVGRIEGGTAENIIAEKVFLSGTMRAIDPEVLLKLRQTIERLLHGLETSMRVRYKISYSKQVPSLLNDKAVLEKVLYSARSMLGNDKVVEMDEGSMGTEDFAYISSKIPSVYLRIGSKSPDSDVRMVHRPDFAPNEAFLDVAMRLISRLAIDFTGEN
ncbi:MAG: amidohydrolase [Desulfobacterales bacterium]|nr:amidohydrolase [Desulfobacterales bacterium]